MKVTVLVENTSENKLISEHGLSMLIEYNGENILLDAGSTEAFYKNAEAMGISLENIKFAVLSHGHYDHSGGFGILFENNTKVKVYAQKSAVNKYYSSSGGMHEIGIPEKVLKYKERFKFIDGFARILDGVYLVSHSSEALEKTGCKSGLYKKEHNSIVYDDFNHEQSLVFDTKNGLVIFNSCSHGGVENIIREVKEVCGYKKIYAYVGGFHMKGKINGKEICIFSNEEIASLCSFIEAEQIKYIYTGHCTGIQGLEKMQQRLGDTVRALTTGLQFEL